MACMTAYVIFFCSETHYEKCLRKVSRFVHEQNEKVWTKRGLLITDPVERGLRVIEITILTEPLHPEVQVVLHDFLLTTHLIYSILKDPVRVAKF